ncbi:MAG: hypothetical protein WAN86_26780 [Hyphomicrobiaceae bacterium]
MAQNMGVAALLTRALLLIATLAFALLNGFSLSPVFDWADYMLGVVLRGYPYMTRSVINAYITPLAVTLMTLAIAGIPAAAYERIRGLKSSTAVSLAIWLVAAVLLALPAIMRAVAGDELG